MKGDLNEKYRIQKFASEQLVIDHQDPKKMILQTLKTQKTEEGELYQQSSDETQEGIQLKHNIDKAIYLIQHKDSMIQQIEKLTRQLQQEQSKTSFLMQQRKRNQSEIGVLQAQLQQMAQQQRLTSLNESSIPNKSTEMSITCNNNSWITELLSKHQLESLWEKKDKKANTQPIAQIKRCTIDLSQPVKSTTLQLKESLLKKTNKVKEKGPSTAKKLISSVAYSKVDKRYDLKLNLNEKTKGREEGGGLSYARKGKARFNPQM